MTEPTALVIGGNGGMGLSVIRTLLTSGYRVGATVSSIDALFAFTKACPDCVAVEVADLARSEDLKTLVERLIRNLGSLDAVIICAAVAPFAPAETTAPDVFRRTMEINCLSNLAVYQACLPALRQTRGRMIFTGSWSGVVATPMMASYVASKFALEGLVDVMRQEAGAWGVEVVLVQPGALDTQMMRRSQASLAKVIADLPADEEALYGRLYRQMKYRADEGLAAQKFTSPDTVAAVIVHALEVERPETRYPVGSDAEYMCDMARSRTDREIDAVILDMYQTAPLETAEKSSDASATAPGEEDL
ncbi:MULTISPECIES: SDR family NAD(P)-dependent oxidoreductase [Sphingobium]|uniref:SDR family NAD(P)-dependent oxidoreductase n=1 Tax=Sphingobium sp. MI1205 TaxID=407020 RepID=UPI000770023A|nr:SDR family NAD(P)-dependent oxidoreductase [Sphingobium sp. MI1205]AMK20470.1 short-chain dehydrogenase/reductase SDR [Sphingobium sp. MI1205]